jgi:alcohol dehydrogenase class IV
MTKPFSNWSFPTAIRFGAGRIKELPEAISKAGMKNPLFVTDPGLAKLPVTASTLKLLSDAGVPTASFPMSGRTRSKPISKPASQCSKGAAMTGSSPSAAGRRSISAS